MNNTPRTEAVVKMAVGPMREYAIIKHAQTLERELLKAQAERDEAREDLEEEKRFHHRTHAELIQTQCRLMDMTQAIILTLEENRHLADGDDCTLAKLKSAFSDWK
jgi:hypothetical protein